MVFPLRETVHFTCGEEGAMRFCSIEQLWEVATDGTRQHTLQLQKKEKCRGRFLGCFSDDFARRSFDRSFVRSLANEVGAAGASGFYTAPAAAAPSPCPAAAPPPFRPALDFVQMSPGGKHGHSHGSPHFPASMVRANHDLPFGCWPSQGHACMKISISR